MRFQWTPGKDGQNMYCTKNGLTLTGLTQADADEISQHFLGVAIDEAVKRHEITLKDAEIIYHTEENDGG